MTDHLRRQLRLHRQYSTAETVGCRAVGSFVFVFVFVCVCVCTLVSRSVIAPVRLLSKGRTFPQIREHSKCVNAACTLVQCCSALHTRVGLVLLCEEVSPG